MLALRQCFLQAKQEALGMDQLRAQVVGDLQIVITEINLELNYELSNAAREIVS